MAYMANQRAADQVFIGVWVSSALAGKLDALRKRDHDHEISRSQWVRDAIADLLKEEGVPVSKQEKTGKDRVRSSYPAHHPNPYIANNKTSLAAPSEDEEIVNEAEKAAPNQPLKYRRKR